MKFMKQCLLLLVLVIFLSACDCFVNYRGVVLDAETRQPVEKAKVLFDQKTYETDQDGYFEINYITGVCPEVKFEVIKSGCLTYEENFEHNDKLKTATDSTSINQKSVIGIDTLIFFLSPI